MSDGGEKLGSDDLSLLLKLLDPSDVSAHSNHLSPFVYHRGLHRDVLLRLARPKYRFTFLHRILLQRYDVVPEVALFRAFMSHLGWAIHVDLIVEKELWKISLKLLKVIFLAALILRGEIRWFLYGRIIALLGFGCIRNQVLDLLVGVDYLFRFDVDEKDTVGDHVQSAYKCLLHLITSKKK